MAITVTNTDVLVTTGNALTIASGNSAFVNEGASLVSTASGGAAVLMQGDSTLSLNGLAFGALGIRWSDLGDKAIYIGSRGSVQSQGNAIDGTGSATTVLNLVNAGEISSLRNPALINNQAAIDITSMELRLVNTGTISAASGTAIQHFGTYVTSSVENSGTIHGDIRLQSILIETKPDMVFANTGTIHGRVLVSGFDTATATISGTITRSVIFSSVDDNPFQLSTVQLNHATIGTDFVIDGNSDLTIINSMIGRNLILNDGDHDLFSFFGTVVQGNLSANRTTGLDLNLTGGRVNGSVSLDVGNDTLTLGAGFARVIDMDGGDDTVDLAAGAQVISLNLGSGKDTLFVETGATLGRIFAGEGDDSLTMDSAARYANLGSGNDSFIGGNGNDWVEGDIGSDDIATGAGNDIIEMGFFGPSDGNDTIDGGSGTDTLTYRTVTALGSGFTETTGGIYVALDEGLATARASNTANVFGIDILTGIENVTGGAFADEIIGSTGANRLRGEDGNDTLTGAGGADTLHGGDGADRLIGGTGRDVMKGGDGSDTFVFLSAADSRAGRTTRDILTDFQTGIDVIDLSAIDANTALAGSQDLVFAGNVASSGVGTVRYVQSGGNTIVYANLSGNSAAEFGITLHGLHDLKASDFLLV